MAFYKRFPERLAALGFDLPRGRLALRTAVASGLALTLAWTLGLAHPQWAAMTVWISVQPTRGQLLEKSVYRVAGTVGGAAVGTLLLGLLGYQTMGLVIGLALWLGLSAALGNVHRGFTGYGFILAGYSAALVALLGGASTQPVIELGIDRTLTALLGVGVAVLVTWWFTPHADVAAIEARAHRATLRVLRSLCQRLRGAEISLSELDASLAELAGVDTALDAQGVGARRARPLRALLAADTHALLWMHDPRPLGSGRKDIEDLGQRLDALPDEATGWQALAEHGRALLQTCPDAGSQRVVSELERALRDLSAQASGSAQESKDRFAPAPVLHRDWLGSAQAGVRCLVLMLVIGSAWVATGWPGGAYALMGAAVLSTLFSSHEDPSRTMRASLIGHVLAVAAALGCRWLVWPYMGSAAGQVLAIWPLLVVGAILIAHRRTIGAGLEFNIVTLLLLQPGYPAQLSFAASLTGAAGVLVGPMAAALAYRWIYPTNAGQRLGTLRTMMVLDLQRMARASGAGDLAWRARLAHRTLRVAHWISQTGTGRFTPIGAGGMVQALGDAIQRAHALLERVDELTSHEAQHLTVFLESVQVIHTAGDRSVDALRALGQQLAPTHAVDAQLFAQVADRLGGNLAVFQ